MKVILTQDVPDLGEAGDLKNVAVGYARNYLLRQGRAVKATPGAIKEFEQRQGAEDRRQQRLASRAQALADRISKLTLTFEAKAGEKGRLYGSITTADIAEALEREIGEQFDRRKNINSDPLRHVGKHTVRIRLSTEVETELSVVVKPEGGELPIEAEDSAPTNDGPAETDLLDEE